MSVVVRALVVITAPDDDGCDRVLQDLAAHRDVPAGVFVSITERSRDELERDYGPRRQPT